MRINRRTASTLGFATVVAATMATQIPIANCQNTDPIVLLQTTKGPIYIEVFASRVPRTCSNFLELVDRGFYNGLSFHRVESWCIQGGDPNGNGSGHFIDPQTGQPRYLQLEINPLYKHDRPGMVAMARSQNRNSASCQFYITKSAVPYLNGQYAIFGGVVKGMDTVFRITPGDRIVSASISDSSSEPTQQTPENSAPPAPNKSQGESGF